jgi:hypothetical protein
MLEAMLSCWNFLWHSLLKPLEFKKYLCVPYKSRHALQDHNVAITGRLRNICSEVITMSHQKMTTIVTASLFILCAVSTAVANETGPTVPEDLQVAANQILSIEARGIGVQIYECRENKNNPAKLEWVFKAPEAELFDKTDRNIGKHYAGPTWQSTDGSRVVGELKASHKSPENNSIPWLLLRAKSHSGSGAFSRIESIQRLNTVGGSAPAEGCSRDQLGKEIRVPYKAMYYFYVNKP